MVQALNYALDEEMARDDSVVLLGEDIGLDGGVFRVTDGLIEKYGEERVIDTPLAESMIVGTAVGMAAYGLRPVCEIQFSGFAYLSFQQLESQAARLRWRSQGAFHVPLVMRAPSAGGCLLYTSDAADDLLCVDLGGRRIIKNKKNTTQHTACTHSR